MREYLFRGKHSQCDEWLIGFYYEDRRKNPKILIDDPYLGLRECFVIPETVGQFTGLHDKNGKKIFEGDIVRICCGHEEETTINEILFKFGEWRAYDIGGDQDALYNQILNCEHEVEIIGNIHDNPELLNMET